jgi:LuxR family maltose regulon positive regulatory protein
MVASVLTTKLYIPPFRSERVSRLHLVERLNEGLSLGARLTLVSAPAGSGKTTLLSEWAHAGLGSSFAWVSLDEGDNNLPCFLTYVVAALQQVDAHLGAACLALLQAPQPPPVKPPITALINDLAACDGRIVLVLDDYHLLSGGNLARGEVARDATASPAIYEAVTFLLDHMPRQLHLAIASRADPPLALARLRARRQITEIRARDLRFSNAETATFFNQVMKLDLSPTEIETLERRTEG